MIQQNTSDLCTVKWIVFSPMTDYMPTVNVAIWDTGCPHRLTVVARLNLSLASVRTSYMRLNQILIKPNILLNREYNQGAFTWEEAWHVDEGDDRDVEGVTEAHEPRSLHRCVDVQTPWTEKNTSISRYRGGMFDHVWKPIFLFPWHFCSKLSLHCVTPRTRKIIRPCNFMQIPKILAHCYPAPGNKPTIYLILITDNKNGRKRHIVKLH